MKSDAIGAPNDAEELLIRLTALAESFERSLIDLRIEIASLMPAATRDRGDSRPRNAALAMMRCRARVRAFAGTTLFQDTGFDILLDIFASQAANRRVSVMDLCAGIDMPATTSRRWIARLTQSGLLERSTDPTDRRRDWIGLPAPAFESLAIILDPRG